jgi:membrane-associated protein
MSDLIDFILHIDAYLDGFIATYGVWTYALLFFIVFAETGFVVTPFLPGDSLLFAAGALAARGSLDATLLAALLIAAAITGNTLNYFVGRRIGTTAYRYANGRWLRRAHLDRTQAFYDKHGGKAIVLTRFFPILRTVAPFIAGIGRMPFGRFSFYNILGGCLWVLGFVVSGYLFGNLPFIRDHFTAVVMGIIFVSLLPALVEFTRSRLFKRPPPALL